MNVIGKDVIHKSMGIGTIAKLDGNTMLVQFKTKDVKFIYPDAFKQFLAFINPNDAEEMAVELSTIDEQKKAALSARLSTPTDFSINKVQERKRDAKPNIAFKCNFCDGGIEKNGIGFNGVCSDAIIYNNIKVEQKTWCCSDDCACLQFLNGEISREDLVNMVDSGEFICYESQMLKKWKAMAGIIQHGDRKGQPMHLNNVQTNSLCILTSREPYSAEEDRFIFAVFLVDQTYNGDDLDEGYVSTKSKFKIQLTSEQAHQLPFWEYHANGTQPEIPAWNSGLHRYITDEQAAQILRDIVKIKIGTEEEALTKEFFDTFCSITKIDANSLSQPNGALCR